jgi:hypothetical protein
MRIVIQQYDQGQRSGFLGPYYWTFEIDENQESIHTTQRQSHFFTDQPGESLTQSSPSPPPEQYQHQLHGDGSSSHQQQQQLQVTDVTEQHPTQWLPQEREDKLNHPDNGGELKLKTNKFSPEQCMTPMSLLSPWTQKKAYLLQILLKNLNHTDKPSHHQVGLNRKSP